MFKLHLRKPSGLGHPQFQDTHIIAVLIKSPLETQKQMSQSKNEYHEAI